MSLSVVKPTADHRAAWERLFASYADFYKKHQTAEMRERVWGWLHDPAAALECFLVLNEEGEPVGLAHYREFHRPLDATMGGYLDDLFVASEARGSGAVDALFSALSSTGRERGWSVIRWITADDNYRARGSYDRVANRTTWITYDLPL